MRISQNIVKIIALSLVFLAVGLFIANEIMGLNLFAPKEGVLRFVQKPFVIAHNPAEVKCFYAPESGGYFYATKDGIKYMDIFGNEQVNAMYSLREPQIKGEGNIAAVCERNGKSIYVYSNAGLLYEGQSDYPIISFSINRDGFSSIITKRTNGYGVKVFNSRGGVQSEGVLEDTNVFPITSDISKDNKALAIAALDINNMTQNSVIMFIYINQSDTLDIKDGIVGSNAENIDQLIGQVRFMKDNKVLSVSDKAIKCIDLSANCATMWEMPLKNKITAISFTDVSKFAVAYGEATGSGDGEKPGTVKMFDLQLNLLGSYDLSHGKRVTSLNYAYETLVIGAGRNFIAVNKAGDAIWEFDATTDVSQFLLVDNNKTVLASGDMETSFWSLEMETQDSEISQD